MSTFRRRLIMSIKNTSRLPETFQEVEYIESTGTQYIGDTYTIPNNASSFDVEAITKVVNKAEYCIVGNDAVKMEFGYSSAVNRQFLYIVNISAAYISSESNLNRKNYFKGSIDNSGYSISTDLDGGSYSSLTTYKISSIRNASLVIMAYYRAGGNYNFKGKIYSIKYTTDNVLVRDFVPCYRKADNVIGLYDLVNDVFYTNSGTGVFLKGDDV